ncbi:MAG: Gfo/Idh/MocA family oxidoreductase, partial [Elusimicrobia bacterium]|nr:Gfo/Idh/MocA family oxidoreductase [Elusimicrobiota bacterium]
GAGVWGKTHVALYSEHPGIELAAVCDLDPTRAEALAAEFKIPRAYSDFREMISKCRLDAASIVTPDFAHADPAVACAEAGVHMLIEKPLATSRPDVERIVAAVERHQVRVMVDLHNRWSPPFAVAKQSLDVGELGRPVSAYFRLNDQMWVATRMLPWAAKSSILWFLGSHAVDTVRWFFDDEVDTVYSVSSKGVLLAKGVDTDDVFQTILKFKRGGIATLENGWITPDTSPCVNDIKFNITGDLGMINLDLSNSQLIERFTGKKNDRPDVLVKHFIHGQAKGFAYESIRHFIDRLVTGEKFLVSLKDAANTSLVILAIMESAKTGVPVKVRYLD